VPPSLPCSCTISLQFYALHFNFVTTVLQQRIMQTCQQLDGGPTQAHQLQIHGKPSTSLSLSLWLRCVVWLQELLPLVTLILASKHYQVSCSSVDHVQRRLRHFAGCQLADSVLHLCSQDGSNDQHELKGGICRIFGLDTWLKVEHHQGGQSVCKVACKLHIWWALYIH